MSPLLTARPSVTVTLRLAGACVATALIAVLVAIAGGGTASSAAVPAALCIGAVCAALVAHMLYASVRAADDPRLAWMSAGVTVAVAGNVLAILASSAVFPGGGLVTQDGDAGVARYVLWHAALVGVSGLALVAAPRLRWLAAFGGACLALLVLTAATSPFEGFIDTGGYTAITRVCLGAIVLGQVAALVLWWRRANGG